MGEEEKTPRRKVRLLGNEEAALAWLAVSKLSKGETFVHIDEIGEALLGAKAGDELYLQESVTKHPQGWTEHTIASALSECCIHQTVEHEKTEDGANLFRSVPVEQHDLWTYRLPAKKEEE